MRHAEDRRLRPGAIPPLLALALALALAIVLGGCGGASNRPRETLAAATAHGLSYTVRISVKGKQECTTETFSTSGAVGRPVVQSSQSCGPPPPLGHPALIQAQSSPESLVLDVTAGGCGAVRGGRPRTALRPLVTRCSSGKPQHRVTILPAARRLVIVGIPGVPVVNFPRHRCRGTGVCVTPLA